MSAETPPPASPPPPATLTRRIGRIAFSLGAIALAVMVAVSFVQTKETIKPKRAAERLWSVAATTITRQNVRPTLRLFGETVAGREVELRAGVEGQIVETWDKLGEGAAARKGQMLVRLDPFERQAALAEAGAGLAETQARLAQARAQAQQQRERVVSATEQLDLLQRNYERLRQLAQRGVASQKQLDDQLLALSRGRQDLAAAETSLTSEEAGARQQEASIDRAEISRSRMQRELEKTAVVAPFDGFLRDVAVAQGRRVNANERLATLIDANRIEARVALSDAQFGRLAPTLVGSPVQIGWRLGSTTLTYRGTVDRLGGSISAASGGVDIYIAIQDLGLATDLRPGAFVEIGMNDAVYRDVVRLPAQALDVNNAVYVIDADNRLVPRPITIEGSDGAFLLVRGADFVDGERIATTLFPEAGRGAKVRLIRLDDAPYKQDAAERAPDAQPS